MYIINKKIHNPFCSLCLKQVYSSNPTAEQISLKRIDNLYQLFHLLICPYSDSQKIFYAQRAKVAHQYFMFAQLLS
jgi:hypothetical protein